jgi:hypothetical protein
VKHPAGPPMTLGNMRELGVQRLACPLPAGAVRTEPPSAGAEPAFTGRDGGIIPPKLSTLA